MYGEDRAQGQPGIGDQPFSLKALSCFASREIRSRRSSNVRLWPAVIPVKAASRNAVVCCWDSSESSAANILASPRDKHFTGCGEFAGTSIKSIFLVYQASFVGSMHRRS